MCLLQPPQSFVSRPLHAVIGTRVVLRQMATSTLLTGPCGRETSAREREEEREREQSEGSYRTVICRGLVAPVFVPMDQSGNVPLVSAQWTLS